MDGLLDKILPIDSPEGSESPTSAPKKKKKSGLAMLKAKGSSIINTAGSDSESPSDSGLLSSELVSDAVDLVKPVVGLSSGSDHDEALPEALPDALPEALPEALPSLPEKTDENTPIPNEKKKKKNKGALARLKERQSGQNSSLTSLRSQEIPDLQDVADDAKTGVVSTLDEQLEALTDNKPEIVQEPPSEDIKNDENEDLNDDDDEEKNQVLENYEKLLTSEEDPPILEQATKKITDIIKPTFSTGLPVEAPSMKKETPVDIPETADSVRESKRSWQVFKSKLGLFADDDDGNDSLVGRPASNISLNTTCSSAIHTPKMSTARHKNFLVGQKHSHSSLMGARELDRLFPERKIEVFYGTYNCAEVKNVPDNLVDFVLPKTLENVPHIFAITTQENTIDRQLWEIALQETIGLTHVLYHSLRHGTLHIAIFLHRDLIWYCSTPEEDRVTVRAFKDIKTKGAVAISFTLFGTSMIFLGSHFKANEGNEQARVEDYKTINSSIKLPRAVVENPLQTPQPLVSQRFDCVFWAGDFNFRITKERDLVLSVIEAIRNHGDTDYGKLLKNDELSLALARGEIFENFQEGHIRFLPTYKFDLGTDDYDTSHKVRIPSYTDRIMYKSRKKATIECIRYDSATELLASDHKPVYGLYEVKLKPGGDKIPLSGGQFKRDIYMEAAKKRALARVAANIGGISSAKSSVCSVM